MKKLLLVLSLFTIGFAVDVKQGVSTPTTSFTTFNQRVAQVGASNFETHYINSILPVSGKLQIPATFKASMLGSSKFTSYNNSSTDTLEFLGSGWKFSDGCFGDSLTVIGLKGEVRPEWWGANGDSVTDDYRHLKKMSAITIKKVFTKKYRVASNLTIYGVCYFENGAKLIPDNGDTISLDTNAIIYSCGDWDDISNGGIFNYGKSTFENRLTTEIRGGEPSANIGYPGNIIKARSSVVHGGTIGFVNRIDSLSELSIIGGAYDNQIRYNSISSTIAGGSHHIIDTGATHSFIGGGSYNKTNSNYNSISGGRLNQTFCNYGTISGGQNNTVGDSTETNPDSGRSAFIGGGGSNKAYKLFSTISGGYDNLIDGRYSSMCGGTTNIIYGANSHIGGGLQNVNNDDYNSISGGRLNKNYGIYATISGGQSNLAGDSTIHQDSSKSPFIGGGSANKAISKFAVISGGNSNTASANSASICGGETNTATGIYTHIGGGSTNNAASNYSSIIGGRSNCAFGTASVVSGGQYNVSGDSTKYMDSSRNSFVGGGNNNTATGLRSIICGGSSNVSSGANSIVIGGSSNTASGSTSLATGESATASGLYSFAMGENLDASGRFSFASGSESNAYLWGQKSHASSYFTAKGDAQISDLVARKLSVGQQTNNLDLNGGTSNPIRLPNNTTWNFNIQVIARNIQTADENGSWNFQGAIKRNADSTTTALVGSVNKTTINAPTGWDCNVTASTLGYLLITQSTSAAVSDSIRWVGRIQLVEVAE
jgi:hypothetical protein